MYFSFIFFLFFLSNVEKIFCCPEAVQDAQEIFRLITENHPGIYNIEDKEFPSLLKKEFERTLLMLEKVHTYQDGIPFIAGWLAQCDDPHLRFSPIPQPSNNAHSASTKKFSLEQWESDIFYISIPTFSPTRKEEKDFTKIFVDHLEKLQRAKNIIFDVRNNSGGSSINGKRLTRALFGDLYIKQKEYTYQKDTTAHWRASKENVKYAQDIFTFARKKYKKSSDIYHIITNTIEGMANALEHNSPFYSEALKHHFKDVDLQEHTLSLCNARIFVLIDKNCASATLDFIDRLQWATNHECVLIGTPTAYDTDYMECRRVVLPSGKGAVVFPIKWYQNRYRKSRQHYIPHILHTLTEASFDVLKEWLISSILPLYNT